MIVNNRLSGFSWQADTSELFKQREKTATRICITNTVVVLVSYILGMTWLSMNGRVPPQYHTVMIFGSLLLLVCLLVAGAYRLHWVEREWKTGRSWTLSDKNEEGQTRDEAVDKYWDSLGFSDYPNKNLPTRGQQSWQRAEGGGDTTCTYGIWTQPCGLRVTHLSFVGPVIAKRHLRLIPVHRFTVSLDGPNGLDTEILHIWRHNGEEPNCQVVEDLDCLKIHTVLEAFQQELLPFKEREDAPSPWLSITRLIEAREMARHFPKA